MAHVDAQQFEANQWLQPRPPAGHQAPPAFAGPKRRQGVPHPPGSWVQVVDDPAVLQDCCFRAGVRYVDGLEGREGEVLAVDPRTASASVQIHGVPRLLPAEMLQDATGSPLQGNPHLQPGSRVVVLRDRGELRKLCEAAPCGWSPALGYAPGIGGEVLSVHPSGLMARVRVDPHAEAPDGEAQEWAFPIEAILQPSSFQPGDWVQIKVGIEELERLCAQAGCGYREEMGDLADLQAKGLVTHVKAPGGVIRVYFDASVSPPDGTSWAIAAAAVRRRNPPKQRAPKPRAPQGPPRPAYTTGVVDRNGFWNTISTKPVDSPLRLRAFSPREQMRARKQHEGQGWS